MSTSTPTPDPDRPDDSPEATDARERAEIREDAADAARGIAPIRMALYGLAAAGGATLTVVTAPPALVRPIERAFGIGGPEDRPYRTARERVEVSRGDATRLIDEIVEEESRVQLRTIKEEDVKAAIDRYMKNPNDSDGNRRVWNILNAWQDRELVKIARRYRAIETSKAKAADPNELYARLPQMRFDVNNRDQKKGALGFAEQLRKAKGSGDTMDTNWKRWSEALNDPADNPAHRERVRVACSQMRAYIVETGRRPFSADLAVAISRGGYPINATGAGRLADFEKKLLNDFILERFAMKDMFESYRETVSSVKTAAKLHKENLEKMRGHGLKVDAADARQKGVDARLRRILAAGDSLQKTLTVLELYNASALDPALIREADAAVQELLGFMPPEAEIAVLLRNRWIRLLDEFRAEFNNDHPDWVEAEKILRAMTYTLTVPPNPAGERRPEHADRGDPNAPFIAMRAFLERTKDSGDDRTRHIRAICEKLMSNRPIERKHAQEVYDEIRKHQSLPFAHELASIFVEWCGENQASFRDPAQPLRRQRNRDRYARSRQDVARQIIRAMWELERLSRTRMRLQAGGAPVTDRIEDDGARDSQYVLDPQVGGNLRADLVRQSVERGKGVRTFFRELGEEHNLKPVDLEREAASGVVRMLRMFLNVLEKAAGQDGQNTPQSIELREIVQRLDRGPLERLDRAYDALLAYFENSAASSDERAVKNRRVAKEPGIESARAAYNKTSLTRESVGNILSRLDTLTPEEQLGLRLALEDQRQDAVKPFLTEEFANLLALAAYSDEWSGVLGEMQNGQWAWWQTALFIIGLITTYKGTEGVISLKGKRREFRRFAEKVMLARLARKKSAAPPPVGPELDLKTEKERIANILDSIKAPKMKKRLKALVGRFEALKLKVKKGKGTPAVPEPPDDPARIVKMDFDKAHELETLAKDLEDLCKELLEAETLFQDADIPLDPADQARLRVATHATVHRMEEDAKRAIDAEDERVPLAAPSRGRQALGLVHQNIGGVAGRLFALQPDMPLPPTPTLDTLDIDGETNPAVILIVACQEGLGINDREIGDLRKELTALRARKADKAAKKAPPTRRTGS